MLRIDKLRWQIRMMVFWDVVRVALGFVLIWFWPTWFSFGAAFLIAMWYATMIPDRLAALGALNSPMAFPLAIALESQPDKSIEQVLKEFGRPVVEVVNDEVKDGEA